MANKWRTSIAEANAVLHKYSINPSDTTTEVMVRRWDGIDRTYVDDARTILKAAKTVTDPKADNITFEGTWTVGNVWYDPVDGSNIAGSTSIYQELKPGNYTQATPDNLTIMRSRAYPLEQNENSWMYYERFKSEVTSRWHNIAAANIEDEYDKLRQIYSTRDGVIRLIVTDTYKIFYIDPDFPAESYLMVPHYYPLTPAVTYKGTTYANDSYCISDKWYTGSYKTLPDALFPSVIANPVIRECWYEQNPDGTYNLFRTIETTSDTCVMRTHALTYAGMVLVQGAPALDDTSLILWGFEKTTEKIYKHARFMVGSTTYRVTADATCVATDVGGVEKGQATVSVTPSVSQSTEDSCDDYPRQVQALFIAL